MLLKVFFARNVPIETTKAHVEEVRACFAAGLLRYEATLVQIKSLHAGNPGLPYWLLTVNYGRAEAQMIVRWCEETLATLATMAAPRGPTLALRRRDASASDLALSE